ncbi:MAG: efflux RND transporter permease subunit [Pirellulales bacterium]
MRFWQDHVIAPRLEKLSGVAEVATVGGFTPEIESNVSAVALLEAGVTLTAFEKQLSELISNNSRVQSLLAGKNCDSNELFTAINDLEGQSILSSTGDQVPLSKLCNLTIKPAPRYGSYEQDGTEAVAGIVHMTAGENTVEVTRRVLQELADVQKELPQGWTCLPSYDRLELIGSAVGTVTRTLLEALIVTTVCIVLVMRHWRTSLAITLTLPLSVLGAALGVYWMGGHDGNLNANIMSLAGVAVSIGILVDATVVIVENISHRLKQRYRSNPVTGSNIEIVAQATAQVALPATMSVVLMIISFLPLFALGGLDGQMMRPLVWSKTLTLLSVIVLTLTLVPCLATDLIRGRLRSERQSKLLRGIISIYSPLVSKVCDYPVVVPWGLSCLAIVASATTAIDWLIQSSIALAVGLALFLPIRLGVAIAVAVATIFLGVICKSSVTPIKTSLRIPLDEGMVMDMPISRPGISLRQATDDLKARNMTLCRFPEVKMAMGKAGRGETAFDPAPIEMIETMVEFRSPENWPSRRLRGADASLIAQSLLVMLQHEKLIEPVANLTDTVRQIVDSGMPRFEAIQREVCSQYNQAFETKLGREFSSKIADALAGQTNAGQTVKYENLRKSHPLPKHLQLQLARSPSVNSLAAAVCILQQASDESKLLTTDKISSLAAQLQKEQRRKWLLWRDQLNTQLHSRAVATWTHVVADEIFQRTPILDADLAEKYSQIRQARFVGKQPQASHHTAGHETIPGASKLPLVVPHRQYDQLLKNLISRFQDRVRLETHTRESLTVAGGELDRSVQMPGWVNVWTRPIQNRIDMLTTGVNSEVGIRVMGDDLNSVVSTSEQIAKIAAAIPGAFGVLADPIRGKDQVDFHSHSSKSTALGADIEKAVQAATIGIRIHNTIPTVIRLQQPIDSNTDPVLSTELPLLSDEKPAEPSVIAAQPMRLSQIGELQHQDSAATIKSTDGLISNYVRLNVVGRSAGDWVENAQKQLSEFQLPTGVKIDGLDNLSTLAELA